MKAKTKYKEPAQKNMKLQAYTKMKMNILKVKIIIKKKS